MCDCGCGMATHQKSGWKTNRKTGKKFKNRHSELEKAILDSLGIKKLTPRVDQAVALYRENERNPQPDYLQKWKVMTADFTDEEWDELTRRVML